MLGLIALGLAGWLLLLQALVNRQQGLNEATADRWARLQARRMTKAVEGWC